MKVFLPTPLRPHAENRAAVEVPGTTVGEAMCALIGSYPGLKGYIYSDDNSVRGHVNIYLNDEDVRHLPGKQNTPVREGVTLTIMPSIAGGTGFSH